jgi:hypothetical protein
MAELTDPLAPGPASATFPQDLDVLAFVGLRLSDDPRGRPSPLR